MYFYKEQNVFDEALDRIRFVFDECDDIIVSMSGGKDSAVLFELAMIIAKERNRLPLKVFWLDQEAEWQATVDYMKKIMHRPDVKPYWFQIEFDFTNSLSHDNNFLRVWDKNEESKWVHPKDEISIKENPSHPDKVADRIAGAIVDLAYSIEENPKVAVEVLLGHKHCYIIIESSVDFDNYKNVIFEIVYRIVGTNLIQIEIVSTKQDKHLAENQSKEVRCGDNGIFKGMPLTEEEKKLSYIAKSIYGLYKSDGKYILDKDKLIICQSKAKTEELKRYYPKAIVNPLGDWTGGTDVDSGATNRKLGSDMAQSVTGGGLHGKDLSKADVSVNIYAFLKAQKTGKPVELCCAIGDTMIDGKPYSEIVEIARQYIKNIGGFEKFAEWGLF